MLRTLERAACGPGGAGSAAAPWSTVSPDLPLAELGFGNFTPVCVLVSVLSLTLAVCSCITTESVCVVFFSLHLKADFSPGTQPARPQGALSADGAVPVQSCAVRTFTVKLGLGKMALSR